MPALKALFILAWACWPCLLMAGWITWAALGGAA